MYGEYGIGCISDYEAQPILIRSHHGTFSITTVGKINNTEEIVEGILKNHTHFFEMQNGEVNQTELVAAIINQKENFIEGIRYAQEIIDGSMSMLILTCKGIYAVRDKYGRTPVAIGSRVPAWPIFFWPSLLIRERHCAELSPLGLFNISMPCCCSMRKSFLALKF